MSAIKLAQASIRPVESQRNLRSNAYLNQMKETSSYKIADNDSLNTPRSDLNQAPLQIHQVVEHPYLVAPPNRDIYDEKQHKMKEGNGCLRSPEVLRDKKRSSDCSEYMAHSGAGSNVGSFAGDKNGPGGILIA